MIATGLHETFGVDRARITPEADLKADLDLDSIDAVDLAVRLQKLTGTRLTQDVFARFRTVGDVADAVEALTRE
jgi:acyl carrier protein